MGSPKNFHEIYSTASIRKIEGISIKYDMEKQPEKTPVNKNARPEQQSEIEKAFENQDTGFKNALELF
jgi:hypothetical protein